MDLKINLGKTYSYLREVLIFYLGMLIIISYLIPLDDNTGELYMLFLMGLIGLILIREICKSCRFCGVSDMLIFYGNSSKITWEASMKNGLVDHIYYSFSDSSFKYELDYQRCKMHRQCGFNEYMDFISKAGDTCLKYREFLSKNYSGEHYENLRKDRSRSILCRVILFTIIFFCLYNFINHYIY